METKQTYVYCFIGPSGSGKDFISNYIMNNVLLNASKDQQAKINFVKSYTTRERRRDDQNKIFISMHEYQRLRHSGCYFTEANIAAYQYIYGNHYWTTEDNIIKGNINFYIVDIKGYINLVDRYSENPHIKIIPIIVDADIITREKRLVQRYINEGYTPAVAKEKSKVRIIQDKKEFYELSKVYKLGVPTVIKRLDRPGIHFKLANIHEGNYIGHAILNNQNYNDTIKDVAIIRLACEIDHLLQML